MSARVESEPIRLTFVPSLIEEKRAAHAAFLAKRDAETAAMWAEIAAHREAGKTAPRWMEERA